MTRESIALADALPLGTSLTPHAGQHAARCLPVAELHARDALAAGFVHPEHLRRMAPTYTAAFFGNR